MRKNILIIGTIPPPIGGVSIHVKRLLDSVEDLPVFFCDYKRISIWNLIFKGSAFKVLHLHISNPKLRFFLTVIFRALFKKIIVTFHGDLGRFKPFDNKLDELTVKWSTVPILINKKSFDKARILNSSSIKISAFIPPLFEEALPSDILEMLIECRSKFSNIFSTNCSNYTLDNDGQDVYQIINLINVFRDLNCSCLIISDPKNSYESVLNLNDISVPDNVIFIKKEHSFVELLKNVDCFLRYTTTDGDSLSIHEALSMSIPVVTTDVVPRPIGVTLVALNLNHLKQVITDRSYTVIKTDSTSEIQMIRDLYNNL